MCGRFTLHTPIHELVERFGLYEFDFPYATSYNIAPTQPVLTIVSGPNTRKGMYMRWGLVSPWQKQGQGRPLINARLETIAEKPTFRGLVNQRRCLILADGFFEWIKEGTTKYPVYITLDQGKPFAFAGLWDNEKARSCTIVTQDASSALRPIHDRMPVILTPDSEALWLSAQPFPRVAKELPDQESQVFKYHPVSTLVNSPKNNDASLIVPNQ